jgi:adhesin transport system outer membrane protein
MLKNSGYLLAVAALLSCLNSTAMAADPGLSDALANSSKKADDTQSSPPNATSKMPDMTAPYAASTQPQPPPLSLESAILFAMHQNPAIKSEVEKIKQAHFAVDEARAAYYPQVSLNMKGGHEYDDPAGLPSGASVSTKVTAQVNSMQESVLISQILYNGFATDEDVARRKALENSSTYGSLVTIEGILNNAVGYYVDVWHYQREVTESQHFVDSLQKVGSKVSLMNEAGAESKAKKEYVDSRVAAAKTDLNKVKALLADALSNLEALTGSLPEFSAQRPMQMDPTVRPLTAYYDLARTDNNHLLLNASDHAAVEHQINQQESTYMPTVSFQVDGRHGYDVGGHVGNTWDASQMVVLDYKIFDGYQRDASIGKLKAQAAENEFRQQQLERDTDKDIRKAYNDILSTKQDLASNMQEILSSENLQDLYQKQFELGEGDIITMIEGSERLHTARLNSFKLEAAMVVDSFSLLQKVGALRKEKFCASC